jgi:hypothetical protein
MLGLAAIDQMMWLYKRKFLSFFLYYLPTENFTDKQESIKDSKPSR